ncbi:hypothetical protein B0H19DRAFT_1122632 [Mycena capillaripes]|nr:hypothetical protein B0H19DRAFT_1122632 [Mycena capillaripes]
MRFANRHRHHLTLGKQHNKYVFRRRYHPRSGLDSRKKKKVLNAIHSTISVDCV